MAALPGLLEGLDAQLARRGRDQGVRLDFALERDVSAADGGVVRLHHPADDGEKERCCFAGARLRTAHDVAPTSPAGIANCGAVKKVIIRTDCPVLHP